MAVRLTRTELDILSCLTAQPGETIPAEQIIEAIWGVPNVGMQASLRVHISHLRRKLQGRVLIETAVGVGYSLTVSSKPQ